MTFEIIEITRRRLYSFASGIVCLAGIRAYWQSSDAAPELFYYAIIVVLAVGVLFIFIILLRGPFVADALADYYLGKPGEEFDEGTKWRIYYAAGGSCEECGHRCIKGTPNSFVEYVRVYVFGYRVGHIDHIIPHSYGGNGSMSNGRLLCADCNLSRSNAIDDEAIRFADSNEETIEI